MKIRDYIFCDDIRHETNNKMSLMGVYHDRILFRANKDKALNFPIPIRLASFVRLDLEQGDQTPDKFKYELLLNGKSLVALEGQINIDSQQKMINVSIVGEGIPLELGSIGLKICILSKEKEIFNQTIENAIIIQSETIK